MLLMPTTQIGMQWSQTGIECEVTRPAMNMPTRIRKRTCKTRRVRGYKLMIKKCF